MPVQQEINIFVELNPPQCIDYIYILGRYLSLKIHFQDCMYVYKKGLIFT